MNDSCFGVLNIHKPADVTSRQVVDRVVRAVRPAKAGHAGTLDPLATGVLVVCVGRATRLIGYVQQQPKVYRARFLLGRRSDTDDISGVLTEVASGHLPSRDEIEAVLQTFLGRIEQIPPRFSAVHINGQRAYKLAREGKPVELSPRPVEIHRLELQRYEYPEVDVEVECGSGTYIRSLGRDLGERLGCGAVMSRLVRTAIGPFLLENAVPPENIAAERVSELLLPAVTAVAHLPQYRVSHSELTEIRHGRRIVLPAEWRTPTEGKDRQRGEVALIGPDEELAAIARVVSSGRQLAPKHVFCV